MLKSVLKYWVSVRLALTAYSIGQVVNEIWYNFKGYEYLTTIFILLNYSFYKFFL